ncbi:MAG: NIPSNAP family protein [Bacteroidales bacterium]
MRTLLSPILIVLFFLTSSCKTPTTVDERDFYQLNMYTLNGAEQETVMDKYLEDAYLPALRRAGIKKVGAFRTIEGKNGDLNLLMVFIPFKQISQVQELQSVIESDDEYLKAAEDFIQSPHDHPPYVRKESILMTAFSKTPHFNVPDLETAKSERVYELRSYQSATEELYKRKVEMFDSGESELFIELGFQPMFFGEVLIGGDMPNLMYMTCHANEAAQATNWESFRDHPEWKEMKVLDRYKNTVSQSDKYFLYPKEYSDF